MPATYLQATDETFALLAAAWTDAAAGAIVGGVAPDIRWPGLEVEGNPPTDKFWLRVSTQGVAAPQTGFSNGALPNANRRYTPAGFVIVALFGPRSQADAWEKLKALAQLARNTFRGKTTASGVIFRNVRIQELDPEALWHRIQVVAEFEYDEIG